MSADETAEKITGTETEKFFTKPLMLIFLTVFIDLVGFGIVIPALPYYAESDLFHATPLDIGLLFAAYSLMQFIFAPVLGSLSDKYGRRPILFFSMLGAAVGYLFIGFAFALWMVFAGRIIGGITGGSISTAQAYVADVTTRENRAKGMGLFGAMFGLGFILGPAIGGIMTRFGIHAPFFFAGILSFANAVLIYFVLPETVKKAGFVSTGSGSDGVSVAAEELPVKKNRFLEMTEVLRERLIGTLAAIYFVLITAFSIMTYAFVLYTMYRFGYNAEQNGYLFAFVGFLSIVFQGGLFGRLAKNFGENPLMIVGCVMMTASLFSIPYIGPESGGLSALLFSTFALAAGNSLASPSVMSVASKVASEKEQGKVLGVLQGGASLARAVGPALGGVLLNNALNQVDDFTVRRTFWTASAIMLAALIIVVYFTRMNRDAAQSAAISS